MDKTDAAPPDKKAARPRVRMALFLTVGIIAVVGSAYYAYYGRQRAYYTGRNLRLLSMLTAQVEGRVEMLAGFVRAQSLTPDGTEAPPAIKIIHTCAPSTTAPDPASAGDPEVLRGIQETPQGLKLTLQPKAIPVCINGIVSIDDLVQPIFQRKVGAAFDVLLIAKADDKDGKVLYTVRPPPVSSTLLGTEEEWIDDEEEPPPTQLSTSPKALNDQKSTQPQSATAIRGAIADRESGTTLLITQLKALKKRKGGWRSEYEPVDPAILGQGTNHMSVSLGDGGPEYELFAQPYTYARSAGSADGKENRWIVCGLVSASRFHYDVASVSTSLVLMAIAITLLALCCWPYLRIALIDPTQPLTITDVVLIIFCTIAGAAVLTLAVLDGFAYRGICRTADEQLKNFSGQIDADFGRNIKRAMAVLNQAEILTQPEAKKWTPPGDATQKLPDSKQNLPDALLSSDALRQYPYVDSIAWIDDNGMQQIRYARIRTPLADVGTRQYFSRAKLDRTWSIDTQPYVLEWVRSKATGEDRAVLAKKTDVPNLPVIALSTELIDVSHAVRPPGVEMAIIDENGEVVYHSDTQRIGYENFFVESDRDRDLRSAVLARRAGIVSATYWGEDQSMYVQPLKGSAWTLVTFRPKRLTRVLNVEATLLTLVMLLLSASPYLIVYVIVLLLWPRYRAPRLWPDESRKGDYLRLAFILVPLLLLFCFNNYLLMPWSSLSGIIIIPLLSLITTYLILHRTGTPRRFSMAVATWLVVVTLLAIRLGVARIRPEHLKRVSEGAVRALLVLATLAIAALTVFLLGSWKRGATVSAAMRKLQLRYGYSALYRACGVLLILIGVTLPVVGFFGISRHVELELLVKYAQLRAASDLEHRIDHVVTMNAVPNMDPGLSGSVYGDILQKRLGILFDSQWNLDPPLRMTSATEPAKCAKDAENEPTIPHWAASWLPALYEDSIAIQPLFESKAADDLWHWCVDGQIIKLVRKVHFDSDIAAFLWPPDPKNERIEQIVIVSSLPLVTSWGNGEHDPAAWLLYGANKILIALPLLALFWYIVGFVAKRVLLIDIHEPDWLARKPLSPSLGDHIFLVRRDRAVADFIEDKAFVDVEFEKLDKDDLWSARLTELDSSEAGKNIRIGDFEYGINDGAINEKKLQWLERLLALGDRTVIVISSVGPTFVLTTPAPAAMTPDDAAQYRARWRELLRRFVTVTAEELDLRHEEWERRKKFSTISEVSVALPNTWLKRETGYNAFLRRLAQELEADSDLRITRQERDPDTDRQRLLDEITERAETYFAGLWSSCREDEKLVLYYLAHNGLANSRSRRTLRRLIARGLIRRNPNLELFSESFRLYVLAAAVRENIVSVAREKREASTWDALKIPFFVIIISFVLLLFATQKDMLTTTTTLAAALTTGLPVLMKLLGAFTEKRNDAKE
jgi:hypothetical protein